MEGLTSPIPSHPGEPLVELMLLVWWAVCLNEIVTLWLVLSETFMSTHLVLLNHTLLNGFHVTDHVAS